MNGWQCNLCGMKFRSATAEAKHRHNVPALCSRRGRLKLLGITPVREKVLKQAIADGGQVEMDGVDKHTGWGKREIVAALWLIGCGYGRRQAIRAEINVWAFVINEEGRGVVA